MFTSARAASNSPINLPSSRVLGLDALCLSQPQLKSASSHLRQTSSTTREVSPSLDMRKDLSSLVERLTVEPRSLGRTKLAVGVVSVFVRVAVMSVVALEGVLMVCTPESRRRVEKIAWHFMMVMGMWVLEVLTVLIDLQNYELRNYIPYKQNTCKTWNLYSCRGFHVLVRECRFQTPSYHKVHSVPEL